MTEYNNNLDEIILDSLGMINAIGDDQSPSGPDKNRVRRVLNRLITRWQAQDIHLWKKKTGYLFLKKGQASYEISLNGDNATLEYYRTTLKNAASSGTNTIVLTNATGIAVDDYIGIVLNDLDIFWTTVADISGSPTIILTDNLPSDVAAGNIIYFYTNKIANPFNIYSANRLIDAIHSIPLMRMSYQQYFEQPNKQTLSVPTSFMYDRQLSEGIIYLWSTPSESKTIVPFTFAEKITSILEGGDFPDFPNEWLSALISNTAVELAPFYGKNKGDQYAALKLQAQSDLREVLLFDTEQVGISFYPDIKPYG